MFEHLYLGGNEVQLLGGLFADSHQRGAIMRANLVVLGEIVNDLDAGEVRRGLLTPRFPERRYPVVYVLPVEARNERQYGDGLIEVKTLGLADRYDAIFVGPTFWQLPWYADHATNPLIRQESYFLKVVIQLIERTYPAMNEPRGRPLLGFSKSGWGAWSILLRHPDLFGRAAAWDAPLMMCWPSQYGSGDIFGTRGNFERYQIQRLVRHQGRRLDEQPRLWLGGYSGDSDNFVIHLHEMHQLLEQLRIPHEYRDGPERTHDRHSGWMPEAVDWLMSATFSHSNQTR